ncbi:hypothetical protein [Bacillus cereus]|uniref:hypothetical protein n=1 Tax=Bacillus cereus TaxID=1396 RepID=UPI001124FDE1|nr:hypothetical protein [Bacillus cereus]
MKENELLITPWSTFFRKSSILIETSGTMLKIFQGGIAMKVSEYEKKYGEINWDYVQHLFDEEFSNIVPYVRFENCQDLYSFYHSDNRFQMEISKIVDDYLDLHLENLRLSFKSIDLNETDFIISKNYADHLSNFINCSSLDVYTTIDVNSGKVKNVESVKDYSVLSENIEGLSYLKDMGIDISGLEISLAFGADLNYNQLSIRTALSEWSRMNLVWNVKCITSKIEDVRNYLQRTIAKEPLGYES